MHQYFHTTFGFCVWDAAAAAVVIVLAAALVLHIVRQRQRQQEMTSELSEKMALDALPPQDRDDP